MNVIPATLPVVAWVIPRWGQRITPRGSSKLLPGRSIAPGPLQGTIESAPKNKTPSQAEHGLGGRFILSNDQDQHIGILADLGKLT